MPSDVYPLALDGRLIQRRCMNGEAGRRWPDVGRRGLQVLMFLFGVRVTAAGPRSSTDGRWYTGRIAEEMGGT